MSKILILLLIFVTWNAQKLAKCLLSEAIYNRNEIVSNAVPTNTQRVFIRSLTDCAMLCQVSSTCDVFYHSIDTQTCYIYSSSGDPLTYTADSSASCFSKPASSTPAPPTTAATTTSTLTTTPLITTTTTATTTSPQSTTATTSLVTTTTTATTSAALTTTSTPMMTTTTTSTTTPTTTPQLTTTITTTTATATPPNWNPTIVTILNCPSTFTSDVIIPSMYGIFKLRIVHTSVAQAAADTACSNIGMQLFKPDNENKVNEVANVLYSCVVYDRYGYWTDAKRQPGGVGQPWSTSDGESIPTNAWCNSQVGSDASDNCSRLGIYCNYKLKDKECSYVHPSWGYICELL